MNILEHNRTASYVDFVKGARLGFYYSQRLQSLLRQKLGVDQEETQKLYSRLNQGLDGSAVTEANIAIGKPFILFANKFAYVLFSFPLATEMFHFTRSSSLPYLFRQ